MNPQKLSNALRKLGEASYELADALLDTPDPVRSGGPEAGEVAPPAPVATTFEASPFEAQPSFADESVEFAHPKGGFEAPQGSEAMCPAHRKPFVEGNYGLYCTSPSDDPAWSNRKGYCNLTPKNVAQYLRVKAAA